MIIKLNFYYKFQKNITVVKNIERGECILNLRFHNETEILNFKNKYYSKEAFSANKVRCLRFLNLRLYLYTMRLILLPL